MCGDYNFYTGLEPGMQKLLESQANNTGRLYDPLGLQNIAWQDNTTMRGPSNAPEAPPATGGRAANSVFGGGGGTWMHAPM